MAKISKRHHYLPQFYLRRFTADDGLLCLFDRETKEFRKQPPVNTTLEKDFYTVTDRNGVKSDRLEHMFSGLEGVASKVIERLDCRNTGWTDEEQRVSFAIFIAFFYSRTPTFDKEQTALGEHLYRGWMKANHSTPEVTAQWFQKFADESGEDMDGVVAEEFFKMVRDDRYDVEVPRQHNIRLMIDSALHLAEILLMLNWRFVSAPHDLAFITSDAPFTIALPAGGQNDSRAYGVLTPGAASTIPLSPSTCLICEGEGGQVRYGHIRKDAARKINENVAQNSERFVIARDLAYLDHLVKRTRVDQYRWTSRYEFETGEMEGDLTFHAKRTHPPMG